MTRSFLGTLGLALVLGSACSTPVLSQRKVFAMGTSLEIETGGESFQSAQSAGEFAYREVLATEARLSTWVPHSELSRLNRASPGKVFPLSRELSDDLKSAFFWAAETEYAFHPGLGTLVELWGLRKPNASRKNPALADLRNAAEQIRPAEFVLDMGAAVRLKEGFRIEEGGFGKGIALDRAAGAALADGAESIMLNFGGQILVSGRKNPPVLVSLSHPNARSTRILEWKVERGSVSTSGASERGRHIIDPQSGNLVRVESSVTVWASDATAADALSTAMLVMGPEKSFRWLEQRSDLRIRALFADDADEFGIVRVRASCELRNHIIPVHPSVEIQFFCPSETTQPNRKLTLYDARSS